MFSANFCCANQLNGFNMRATLAFNGLNAVIPNVSVEILDKIYSGYYNRKSIEFLKRHL